MLVVCPHCQTSIKIQVDLSLKLETTETASETPLPKVAQPPELPLNSKKVAIAINGEGTREIITELLEEAQFEVSEFSSLASLFASLETARPGMVLADLSLHGTTEIPIKSVIEKALSSDKAKLLLISPGYGKGSVPCEGDFSPEKQIRFSGADGYVERGNIQRDLINKIKLCLSSETFQPKVTTSMPSFAAPILEEEEEDDSPIAPIEVVQSAPLFPATGEVNPRDIEKASRLARIIVSDIILYNEKKVADGVLNGTFYDLLKEEIDEGRKHYNSRVSPEIQKQRDYLGDVLEDFLKKRKAVPA